MKYVRNHCNLVLLVVTLVIAVVAFIPSITALAQRSRGRLDEDHTGYGGSSNSTSDIETLLMILGFIAAILIIGGLAEYLIEQWKPLRSTHNFPDKSSFTLSRLHKELDYADSLVRLDEEFANVKRTIALAKYNGVKSARKAAEIGVGRSIPDEEWARIYRTWEENW
jgi:hypothetical protein